MPPSICHYSKVVLITDAGMTGLERELMHGGNSMRKKHGKDVQHWQQAPAEYERPIKTRRCLLSSLFR
jgi:hypothetical protein